MKTKLPNTVLAKIWKLADVDKDGMLSDEEFALAMYLCEVALDENPIPDNLPKHLVPPSFRSSKLRHLRC